MASSLVFQHDVFISYQWDIKKQVETIHEKLEADGKLKVWRDIHLVSNNDGLYKQLATQIEHSRIFLCFLTKKYCKSGNCLKELIFADKSKKTIIYLMIERMTTEELTNEISFIMGQSLYIQCYNSPASWWIDYFNEIKKSIETNLKVNCVFFGRVKSSFIC